MRKSLQVYRRSATYWWRQILPVDKKKIEIRFSLQTLDPTTAKRRHAAMLVQSFCPKGSWHKDFAAFATAAGFGSVPIGSISMPKECDGVSLRIGWVSDPQPGPFTRLNTPRTVPTLTGLGRQRLSKSFFMREMMFSEVAAIHGLNNAPDDPALALEAGRGLCENLLEPLQDHWGRLAIRSAYRSSEVNGFCNKMQRAKKPGYTCASNEANHAGHIWDRRDANGFMGATACIVVPRFWEAHQGPGDWRLARRRQLSSITTPQAARP